jgi:hypothetical protein
VQLVGRSCRVVQRDHLERLKLLARPQVTARATPDRERSPTDGRLGRLLVGACDTWRAVLFSVEVVGRDHAVGDRARA